jgi:hypothetical protein
MTQREPSAAQSLFPHLPHDAGQPMQRPQPRLAEAMFPNLVLRQPRARPKSRPRLTREEAFDWSNVDPNWARLVGLIRTNK